MRFARRVMRAIPAVQPRLVDLIAALATGAVGSVALVRRDISDTLPGVAIAISLVPPLSVVGFTLEAGKLDQALGASLLFMTNVAAILGSGTSVMALYGFHRLRAPAVGPEPRTVNLRNAVIIIAAMVLAVSVPLAATSAALAHDTSREAKALGAARSFGEAVGWKTGNAYHSQRCGHRPHGRAASVAQDEPAAKGARETRRRSVGCARRTRPCPNCHLQLNRNPLGGTLYWVMNA
jgi:Domain of unknown function (DUF389)